MKKKSLYGMFLILLLVVTTGLSGCWRHSPEERTARITDRLTDELDLDEAQTAKIKAGISKLVEKGKELGSMRESMTQELVKQLRQNQVDEASLNAVVNENKAKLDSMMSLLLQEFSQFHQTLTPEQRSQAAERIEELQERHSHRRSWFG